MFIKRWIEGFKTGDSDIIGMVCCEIGIASVFPAAITAVALTLVPTGLRFWVLVVGGTFTFTPVLFILVVSLIQLGKTIFGPQQHEGFDI